jgi:hypothetical protein
MYKHATLSVKFNAALFSVLFAAPYSRSRAPSLSRIANLRLNLRPVGRSRAPGGCPFSVLSFHPCGFSRTWAFFVFLVFARFTPFPVRARRFNRCCTIFSHAFFLGDRPCLSAFFLQQGYFAGAVEGFAAGASGACATHRVFPILAVVAGRLARFH